MDVNLRVMLADGRTEYVPVREGNTVKDELGSFFAQKGIYRDGWVQLRSGEYVRYEFIVSVSPPADEP
jgi:hypothetical protein